MQRIFYKTARNLETITDFLVFTYSVRVLLWSYIENRQIASLRFYKVYKLKYLWLCIYTGIYF